MTAIEEIKKMRQQGKTEQEITMTLQQKGLSPQEIDSLISQTKIKEAVTSPAQDPMSQIKFAQAPEFIPKPSDASAHQIEELNAIQIPSLPTQLTEPPAEETYSEEYPQNYNQQTFQQTYPQEYPETYPQQEYSQQQYNYQYPSYPQPSISADTISEIAEQVVVEKLSSIREKLEKNIDLKTLAETKLAQLDERLLRIEKIIDRLQLSILQKIGEQMTNTSDLKKELVETQKSFKAISQKHHTHHKRHRP